MRKIIRTSSYKQARTQEWNNTEGKASGILGATDLSDVYGNWIMDQETQYALRRLLQSAGMVSAVEEASYAVNITFSSSGYYDPGRISGRVEDSYAPEGDEERVIDSVILTAQDFGDSNIDGKSIELPQPLASNVGEYFRMDIEAVDLPDPPSVDDARDEGWL